MRFICLVSALILIAFPPALKAQNKKYMLTGSIRDSLTQLPISNAKVLIAGTKYTDSTGLDGTYKILNLIPGTNNLVVLANGYDSAVVKFEIRKDMKLNVKLMPRKKDTATLAKKDTLKVDSAKLIPPQTADPKKTKDNQKEKKGLTGGDIEEIRVLMEDAIFSKSIYFSKFTEKRKKVYVEGSFIIDTGFLYEFEAQYLKKPGGGYELKWMEFTLKGHNVQ